jgi:hypothetical protein
MPTASVGKAAREPPHLGASTMSREDSQKDEIVIVAPNGKQMPVKYHPHDSVAKTLDHAVKEFSKDGVLDQNVSYILVRGESPLPPGSTLEAAGVKPGDKLKIRSQATPGDGDAPITL